MINTSRAVRAGDIERFEVRNRTDEKLGKIEDLVIDAERGRIAYAVLSCEGFLGMGSKLFAVPWDALQMSAHEKKFILNVDKEVLEKAPGFDKDTWPDMADRTWATQVYSHYGYRPYWENLETTQSGRTWEDHERDYHNQSGHR